MTLSINTNLNSLFINNILNKHSNSISTLFERLSTGCRINHAKDDAASCAISASLSSKISSYNIIGNNIQTAQSMVSTAEGAYGNILDMLSRIRDLSLQAINGTYSLEEREVLQDEAQKLVEEIYRVKSTTTFLNKKILGEEAFSTFAEGKKINDELEAKEQAEIKAKEVQKAKEKELIDQGYTAVYTAQELHDALEINNPDCKVVLCADIDLKGFDWVAVGTNSDRFKGTFDGNGNTISNLKINKPDANYQGLFGATSGAIIQNVTLKNVDVKGKIATGGLVGADGSGSTITNCTVSGNVEGTGSYTGGLVGANAGTISNCTSSCNVESTGSYTGGLVGLNNESSKISYCNSSCNIIGNGDRTGGLIGFNGNNSEISYCISSGNVTGNGNFTGGLIGSNHNSSTISYCNSTSDVTGNGTRTGGLVGQNYNNSKITHCSSSGNVTGKNYYIGGLVGINQTGSEISNCASSSNVEGDDDYTGGLVGMNYDGSEISNCASSGGVKGNGDGLGGLVGNNDLTSTITNSATDSKVTAGESATNIGAFVGYKNGTLSNNEYNPTINGEEMNPYGNTDSTTGVTANPNLNLKPKKLEPKEYKDSKVSLQVGIDSSNSSVIEVETGVELGFLDIDLTSVEKARKSLDRVDIMIDKITSKQSELGAISNRLDSASQYQETSILFLNMTNSVIKDTDYALEASKLVRHQILQEVSTSLLTTANQTPSIALRLLGMG